MKGNQLLKSEKYLYFMFFTNLKTDNWVYFSHIKELKLSYAYRHTTQLLNSKAQILQKHIKKSGS